MGARLAKRLYAEWSLHLSPVEMNAAVSMALTAQDADAPPRYYGGWEALARALGYWRAGAAPAVVKRKTQRVVTALVRKGVITSSGTAGPRVRAEYALNLDPWFEFEPSGIGRNITWRRVARDDPRPVDSHPTQKMGDFECPPMGDSERPALGDSESPPKETLQETHQEGLGQAQSMTHDELAGGPGRSARRSETLAALLSAPLPAP